MRNYDRISKFGVLSEHNIDNLKFMENERATLLKADQDNYRDLKNYLLTFSTTGFVIISTVFTKTFLHENCKIMFLLAVSLFLVILCTLISKFLYSMAIRKRINELKEYYFNGKDFSYKYLGGVLLLDLVSSILFIISIGLTLKILLVLMEY